MKKKLVVASLFAAFAAVVVSFHPTVTFAEKGQKDAVAEHLKKFDRLDFDVFTNQKWDQLKESHGDGRLKPLLQARGKGYNLSDGLPIPGEVGERLKPTVC